MSVPKWTEERVEQLIKIVGKVTPVTKEIVDKAAEQLETSSRSVASKLRKMGIEVASVVSERVKTFTDEEAASLKRFVEKNANTYTYPEIAAAVLNGKFSAKEVQGKLLSMELTSLVKRAPKVETAKVYSDEEEATFIKLAKSGAFLEDIASALGKELNSVRGKALSLSRQIEGFTIPKQRELAPKKVDVLSTIKDLSSKTVAEIAALVDKSERGVKTMLTHRGLVAKDYDGAKRAEKIASKQEAA